MPFHAGFGYPEDGFSNPSGLFLVQQILVPFHSSVSSSMFTLDLYAMHVNKTRRHLIYTNTQIDTSDTTKLIETCQVFWLLSH